MRRHTLSDRDTKVECCGHSQSVNQGRALIHGWPKCPKCSGTMRPKHGISQAPTAVKVAIGQ